MASTDFFDEDLVQHRDSTRSIMGQGAGEQPGATDETGDAVPGRPVSDFNLTRMARHKEEVEGQVWATIAVSDMGDMIPAEDLPYIFERFLREEEPHSARISETGVRLIIVKGVVDLHGGRVTVQSPVEENVGSTFTIWLPLAD